jgi:hypothetical protein
LFHHCCFENVFNFFKHRDQQRFISYDDFHETALLDVNC